MTAAAAMGTRAWDSARLVWSAPLLVRFRGGLLGVAGLLLVVALISWNPADPSWNAAAAPAPSNWLGAGGAVEAPAPLYGRLLDRVEVTIGFRTHADGAERSTGAYTVDVRLETPDGWSTELAGVGQTPIRDTASEVLTIELADVTDQVAQIDHVVLVGGSTRMPSATASR